jgi:fructokinase
MNPHRIGVDLGGTKIESILLDPNGNEAYRKRIPTPRNQGYNAILEAIHQLIEETEERIPKDAVYTLGMGIPGIIDQSGIVINANTTILIGNPLKADLERLQNHSVRIDNDANCFTLAESISGAAKGYGLVFGIIMGTGCGGGIAINGRIHSGQHGIAGEWGHVSIDPAGMECWCGNRGCIETKISGSGMERSFEARYGRRLAMHEIIEGYRGGDLECAAAFETFLDDFGRALGGLISILDPDAVVIGGGLSNIDELYTIGVERVKRFAFYHSLRTPILRNTMGDSAGVIGAAWIGE